MNRIAASALHNFLRKGLTQIQAKKNDTTYARSAIESLGDANEQEISISYAKKAITRFLDKRIMKISQFFRMDVDFEKQVEKISIENWRLTIELVAMSDYVSDLEHKLHLMERRCDELCSTILSLNHGNA